jgi:hypothetical protein
VTSRRDWPVRRFRLGEEPRDDLSLTTTPEERLQTLSVEAWILSGLPLPSCARDEMPVVLRTLRDEPGD